MKMFAWHPDPDIFDCAGIVMAGAHDGYYGQPYGSGAILQAQPDAQAHVRTMLQTIGRPLAEWQAGLSKPGHYAANEWTVWQTSGGNLLAVAAHEGGSAVIAAGRRHGIPWWTLGGDAADTEWLAGSRYHRMRLDPAVIRAKFRGLAAVAHLPWTHGGSSWGGVGPPGIWLMQSQKAWPPATTADDHRVPPDR